MSLLTDILTSLASAPGPGVYQSVVEKSLPTLSEAIAVAKLEESWVASTAIELVTSLVSGAPEAGLGEGFFAVVAPSLFKCMEQAEDRDVVQVWIKLRLSSSALLLNWIVCAALSST
jgi:importin-9